MCTSCHQIVITISMLNKTTSLRPRIFLSWEHTLSSPFHWLSIRQLRFPTLSYNIIIVSLANMSIKIISPKSMLPHLSSFECNLCKVKLTIKSLSNILQLQHGPSISTHFLNITCLSCGGRMIQCGYCEKNFKGGSGKYRTDTCSMERHIKTCHPDARGIFQHASQVQMQSNVNQSRSNTGGSVSLGVEANNYQVDVEAGMDLIDFSGFSLSKSRNYFRQEHAL